MTRELRIQGRDCAVLENNRLVEYIRQEADMRSGEVILGKVGRIVSGLNAAFVDIGRGRDGFLPLKENNPALSERPLSSGDRVVVQIKREAHGDKGAFLSRDILLPGMYCLVMPLNDHIGISAKIEDEETRKRLHELGDRITEGNFGMVMRTAAARASDEEIRQEAEKLMARCMEITRRVSTVQAPAVLYAEENPWQRLLNDYLPRGIDKVCSDDDSLRRLLPESTVFEYRETDIMTADIIRQRKEALNRKVTLPHGGTIVIDPCEALTVIDVNTASDAGHGEAMMRTNLEACREIVTQVRLRNLSGIIIVDMIDMKTEAERAMLLNELDTAFYQDRAKAVIHGLTSLGLVEITRKRSGKPLEEMLSPRE